MGRKRKHRESDERILRKIRKLEKKMHKRRRSYSSTNSPTDSESNSEYNCEDINTDHAYSYYSTNYPYCEPLTQQETELMLPESPHDLSVPCEPVDDQPGSPRLPPCDAQPSVSSAQPHTSATQPSTSAAQPYVSIENLDDDILTLLGDAPKEEPAGPDVHMDIASRLQEVLQNGLKKDLKDKILLDYPIPGNCQLFKAPLLNAEVKAAVSDPLLKKDTSLAARQGQIGHALAALAKTLDMLVAEKSDFNQQLIKHVSNACRLICDSHYIDTQLRRNFLISTLNNKLKDTLKESKRDKNLFGEDLSEKLRASKVINKSSQELKYNKPRSFVNRNPMTPRTSANLNWKRPQSNYQTQNRRPVPAPVHHRSAGAQSTPYYRPRAETDGRRRPPPPPRAQANAHYKKRR